jgi:hypothetical protein
MPEITWKRAEIQTRLYDKIGQSLTGVGPCPRVASFAAGYGHIDETTNPPTLESLPLSASEVPGFITSGIPEASMSDGRALFVCAIPEDAVSAPQKCNIIGLYDQDDELVALASFLPEWLAPGKRYENFVYITFPAPEEES